MMTTIEFMIMPSERPKSTAGGFGIWTPSEELLSQVAALGYERNRCSGIVTVVDDMNSPRLAEAYRIIQKLTGMRRSRHRIVRLADREHYFSVLARFSFTKREIDAARLLTCRAKDAIATYFNQMEDETMVVQSDDRLRRNKNRLGSLYNSLAIACEVTMKEKLEMAKLSGLEFRPVLVEAGKTIHRRLWMVWSGLVLPPCLHPLTDGQGEPFTGDMGPLAKEPHYYDSGIEPFFKYTAADIDAMGPFDVALTRERAGNSPKLACRRLIVSQRFRKILTEEGITKVDYTPVLITQ